MDKLRKSNIELLRILAMFMIVAGHAATHGHDISRLPLHPHSLLVVAMSQGARIAVDVFIIITGYFLIKNANSLNLSKISRMYRQIWFYSVTITICMTLFSEDRPVISDWIKSVFPIYSSQYWFATDYIIVILLSPLLNLLIRSMNKRQHGQLLLFSILTFSLVPTIIPINPSFFNLLIWFVILYTIGAYLQLYGINISNHIRYWHGLAVLLVIMCSAIMIFYLGHESNYLRHNTIYLLSEPNKLTALLCALLLFMGFRNLNIGTIKWINAITPLIFAVYLISDHPLIRGYIFQPISQNFDSDYFPAIYAGWVSVIFIICLIIEFLRKKTDEYIFRNKELFDHAAHIAKTGGGGKSL